MSHPAQPLEHEHTPGAIRQRISSATAHSYLGDFVLGAVDGTVTTFAVVTGAAGAGLHSNVALVLGVANLLADGFSMAAGNYLSTKSARQVVERVRRVEERHIEMVPEGEREEIRQIFAAKGFSGPLLDQIVDVITRDRRRWVDTMITEEFGLALENPSPLRAAGSTYIAFVLAGIVPLVPLMMAGQAKPPVIFQTSALLTAGIFFLIGVCKGHVVHRPLLASGLETLFIGSAAAGLSYVVGVWLKGLAG
jgi:VIT1/CCC1 family predicted Fe2+/Mn2+ transporter